MYEHKEEIINTRTGCLGGSDGKLLQQIATVGEVPKSAYKRMAVCKGLIEPENISTIEMRFGDFIEEAIFNHLSSGNEDFQSNPLWVSKKYERRNVKLICHPDIVRIDEKSKTVYVYEVKATKYDVVSTKNTYRAQMFIEWAIATELADELGKSWKVKIYLAHYNTKGVDMENGFEFDPERLSVHKMSIGFMFDLKLSMDIVDSFLSDFNEYYKDDEIDSEYLPEKVRDEFNVITSVLTEIKEREQKVDAFKKKLCQFMLDKGIKSIKNDAWSVTLVNATEAVSFDHKTFISDEMVKHPRRTRKLLKTYEKRSKRNPYITIKIK